MFVLHNALSLILNTYLEYSWNLLTSSLHVSQAALSGAGRRVLQSANSVGHAISACCTDTLSGLCEAVEMFEPHYEEQVEWYKR